MRIVYSCVPPINIEQYPVFHPNGDPLEPKRFRSTQVEYLMDKIMKNSLTLR